MVTGKTWQAHATKEERLASIIEGREGREKFNAKKGHEGGSTNRDKAKRKNPMMIKHKFENRSKMKKTVLERNQAKSIKKRFRGKKKK